MRLSCLQENLARGLAVAGRAVASRSTLPITQNVLLRTENGMLMLSATNLEIAITTWIGAMIEEEGAITVPHRLLSDLVSSMPSDRVDLDLPGQGDDDAPLPGTVLHIACGRTTTRINGAAARDFPHLPRVDEGAAAAIDSHLLRTGIRMVAFSASSDESRPVLTGVEMKLTGDDLSLAAADGFRLAVFRDKMPRPADEDINVIVPAKVMTEVQRLAGEQSAPVRMMLSPEKGQALFKFDNTELVSQLLKGSFPNYEQLIPDRYETRAVMEVEELKQAVGTAAVFAREGSNIVRLEMAAPSDGGDGGVLKVSARSEEQGNTSSEKDITYLDGAENKIAFNMRFIQDVARVLGKGLMAIEVTNSSSPGVFRPAKDSQDHSDRYVHVVMPMYVQW